MNSKKKKAIATKSTKTKTKPAGARKPGASTSGKSASAPRQTAEGSAPRTKKAPPAAAVATVKRAKPAPREKKAARPGPARRTPRELDRFRQMLEAKHADLLASYTSAKGDTRNRQDDGTEDYIDYAVSSYDREFLLSLTELEQKQLMLVDEALKRIDRGDYGLCMECGRQIPTKRLEVQPWASYCVRCQEMAEQGLLQPHSFDSDAAVTQEPVDLDPDGDEELELGDDLAVKDDLGRGDGDDLGVLEDD